MKLTKSKVRTFEKTQKENGTEVALHNILWEVASDLLKDIGCVSIKTSSKHKKP